METQIERIMIVKIECWSTIDSSTDPFLPPEAIGICLCGKVYGHPNKPDGSKVKTSRIKLVQGKLVQTLNTNYCLGEPDPEFIKWMKMEGLEYNPDEPIKIKRRS